MPAMAPFGKDSGGALTRVYRLEKTVSLITAAPDVVVAGKRAIVGFE